MSMNANLKQSKKRRRKGNESLPAKKVTQLISLVLLILLKLFVISILN